MYNMSPSVTCIEEITLDLAAEAVILASHDMIRAKEVSLACDKADEKKGMEVAPSLCLGLMKMQRQKNSQMEGSAT